MSLEQEMQFVREEHDRKENERKLITELATLANEIKQAEARWSREHNSERQQKSLREEIIRSALTKKGSGIQFFHHQMHHALGSAIKRIERFLKSHNIPMKVVADLLNQGGYPPLDSGVYSAVSPTRTSFALFSMSEAEVNAYMRLKRQSLKSSSLAIAGVLGGAGLFTALALLIKSSAAVSTAVAVMKVAAVAATVSSGFPPLAIIALSIGGAALLLAGIGLAVIAIQHYRNQPKEGESSRQHVDRIAHGASR